MINTMYIGNLKNNKGVLEFYKNLTPFRKRFEAQLKSFALPEAPGARAQLSSLSSVYFFHSEVRLKTETRKKIYLGL